MAHGSAAPASCAKAAQSPCAPAAASVTAQGGSGSGNLDSLAFSLSRVFFFLFLFSKSRKSQNKRKQKEKMRIFGKKKRPEGTRKKMRNLRRERERERERERISLCARRGDSDRGTFILILSTLRNRVQTRVGWKKAEARSVGLFEKTVDHAIHSASARDREREREIRRSLQFLRLGQWTLQRVLRFHGQRECVPVGSLSRCHSQNPTDF